MKNWLFAISALFVAITNSSFASTEQKVVLVLGSGGSRGIAHVGVIEELENLGIVPDVIVGCSSGAVVGALYAQHQDIAKVKEILIDLKQEDLIDYSLFQKQAISTREKIESFLKKHLTVNDFESLKIKFIAVATDLNQGEPVYFQEGNLLPIILASAALPGLFPPYEMGDRIYVDGGVTDPLPVQFAHSLGDVVVIASDISPPLDGFDVNNLPEVLRKSFEVIYQRLSYAARQEADILLEMNFTGINSPIEDGVNHELYERGKEAVRGSAEEILKKISILSP
jgi:NTE family protein